MSDIISCLQLDKTLPSRVIVVKEVNGGDSSFIISCVLGHCIKNKKCVIIVSMHNSLPHCQDVGLRMNYSLTKHIEAGLIDFYNLGKETVGNVLKNSNNSLDQSLSILKEKISVMKEKYGDVNIILDGISHLFDLQYSLQDVNNFCSEIIKCVRELDNSLVIFHSNDAIEDDITHIMSNLLCHKAHTIVEVENLPSGLSTDVTGHLIVKHPGKKFEEEHMYTLEFKPQKYLYKAFDRGVKLFAPGTV